VVEESGAAGYRGPQVCTIVGITYRQLDYWARTGLLRPSISDARGSGTQRRYSYSDLVQLKVIKRLLDAGISLAQARRAIECLRATGEDLAAANLVIEEGRTVLAHSGEEIVDLLRGGQGVLNIVPMAGVVSEIRSAIISLAETLPVTAAARREAPDGAGSAPARASGS
jgi:DNA-binding transcriptional MerR regulator